MRLNSQILITLVAAGAVATASQAAVISITSSQDNSLIQNATGDLSNGAGSGMFVGNTHQTGDNIRRALIAFDIASAIPAGSVITSVNLTLTANRTRGGGNNIGLFPVLASWGEAGSDSGPFGGSGTDSRPGDATWIHRFYAGVGGTTWVNEGGDFNPVASATKSVSGTGNYTWTSNAAMIAIVQSWLDSPAQNYGWMIKSLNENSSSTAKRFATKEEPDAASRPSLVIEYTVPATGPAIVLAGGLAMFGRRRRA